MIPKRMNENSKVKQALFDEELYDEYKGPLWLTYTIIPR